MYCSAPSSATETRPTAAPFGRRSPIAADHRHRAVRTVVREQHPSRGAGNRQHQLGCHVAVREAANSVRTEVAAHERINASSTAEPYGPSSDRTSYAP